MISRDGRARSVLSFVSISTIIKTKALSVMGLSEHNTKRRPINRALQAHIRIAASVLCRRTPSAIYS